MTLTNRWAVLALLCAIRVIMGLQLQTPSSLAPYLIAGMAINYAQLGILIGLFMLPGIPLALPGGLAARKIGDRTLVAFALGLMTAGALAFAARPGFAVAFAGRLIGGVGSVLLNVEIAKIAADWFSGRELSTAMGLLLPSWPLGIALGLATLGWVAAATSWPTAVAATGACSAAALALVLVVYRDPQSPARPTDGSRPLWVISRRELTLVLGPSLMWMVVNMAYLVLVSFLPTLLVSRGASVAGAGITVSWMSLLAIGTYPVFGYLFDRLRGSDLLTVTAILVSAVPFFALTQAGPAWPWIVSYGLTYPAVSVAIFALANQVLGPESRGAGFGVFYTFYYAGSAVAPALAGRVVDLSGRVTSALWLAGLLWLLMLPALIGFRLAMRGAFRDAESGATEAPRPAS